MDRSITAHSTVGWGKIIFLSLVSKIYGIHLQCGTAVIKICSLQLLNHLQERSGRCTNAGLFQKATYLILHYFYTIFTSPPGGVRRTVTSTFVCPFA